MEKARRKAEADLKMTIDNLNEMERVKIDLEEVVKKYMQFQYTKSIICYKECILMNVLSFQEGLGN